MAYLIVILLSLFVCFLVVKLFKFVLSFCLILLSLLAIGLIIIPWNMELGIQMATICFSLLLVTILVTMFAGVVSVLIVSPLIFLWISIKSIFIK